MIHTNLMHTDTYTSIADNKILYSVSFEKVKGKKAKFGIFLIDFKTFDWFYFNSLEIKPKIGMIVKNI